jgi:hypothetical protein
MGKAEAAGEQGKVGIDRPTSDPTQRATGVMTTACLYTEIQRNTGNPERQRARDPQPDAREG